MKSFTCLFTISALSVYRLELSNQLSCAHVLFVFLPKENEPAKPEAGVKCVNSMGFTLNNV